MTVRVAGAGLLAVVMMAWLAPTRADSPFTEEMLRVPRAELHVLPPFGPNGHSLFNRAGATSQWGPPVSAFLARIGLPS